MSTFSKEEKREIADYKTARDLPTTCNTSGKKKTYRLCSARINENACKASTIEKDGTFNGGKNTHNHTVEGECNSKDSEVDYAPGSAHEVNCT